MFRAVFWGVRGSIPVPGQSTVEVGGNTSCMQVQCGATTLIFDAGTGLRGLGDQLVEKMPVTVHMFFSHVHWDHIQGFPFFKPAFLPGNTIHMYGGKHLTSRVENALVGQMEGPSFPVRLTELSSNLVFHDVEECGPVEPEPGIRVRHARGHHPGGVYAYRVEYNGKALIYATDTEHGSDADARLLELSRGADVLVYDSMYTPEEYEGTNGESKRGWGHSTFVAGAALAKAAGVKRYVLFHHDPAQDDAQVHEKVRRARELFPASCAATEGLAIDV
jgi:phosphoribosyl 1,2-cyclic phosphodiesterase